jgi:hypothetical protein
MGGIFPLQQGEEHCGWSVQAEAAAALGEGSVFFPGQRFLFLLVCPPFLPPPRGGDVTLTSNKVHSKCDCAVSVISAFGGRVEVTDPLGSLPLHLISEIFFKVKDFLTFRFLDPIFPRISYPAP